MVTRLEWSAKTRYHLNQIYTYYKKKSEQAAVNLFNGL